MCVYLCSYRKPIQHLVILGVMGLNTPSGSYDDVKLVKACSGTRVAHIRRHTIRIFVEHDLSETRDTEAKILCCTGLQAIRTPAPHLGRVST